MASVQLPLPKHISDDRVIEAIDPLKDADGFHPVNIGRMVLGLPGYLPATPYGITELIKRYNIETSGRHCVVIGRSNIVGRPVSILLSAKGMDATVTVLHSRSANLKDMSDRPYNYSCHRLSRICRSRYGEKKAQWLLMWERQEKLPDQKADGNWREMWTFKM